jgi:plasmid stabilization system protein ParE
MSNNSFCLTTAAEQDIKNIFLYIAQGSPKTADKIVSLFE